MINYIKKNQLICQKALHVHCLGWLLFITYDALIGGLVKGSFAPAGNYIVHYVINISLFYFHALVLLPVALKSGVHILWRLPLLLVAELVVYECIVYGVDVFLLKYTNILQLNGLNFDRSFILAYIWRGLYFMLFGTGYYLFIRYKKERDENEALKQLQFEIEINKESVEKKIAEARTAFLMAQINPHFLFNTLNFIYYTTVKTSPEGAASIMLLSKIMRYSSDIENSRALVSMEKEADYVSWLMEIHKIRFKTNFHASFSCTPEAKQWKIIPFLLIVIAENMFKHGLTTDPLYPATLAVCQNEAGDLLINSQNMPKALADVNGLKSGLINLRERMYAQYGNQATLDYGQVSDGSFKLQIIIKSIEYQNI